MFKSVIRTLLTLGVVSLSLIATSAFGDTDRYSGMRTDVALAPGFLTALQSLGVSVAPIGGAKIIGAQARFKIPGAEVDLDSAAGEILHLGGLRLIAGATQVEIGTFIIDTSAPSDAFLSGLVKVNGSVVGRLRLFDLTLPALSLPLKSKKTLLIPNVDVRLNAGAAATLNSVFGVSAFTGGFEIGNAHSILRRVKRAS